MYGAIYGWTEEFQNLFVTSNVFKFLNQTPLVNEEKLDVIDDNKSMISRDSGTVPNSTKRISRSNDANEEYKSFN